MEVIAKARYLRISPRKARLLVDLIRGDNAENAKLQLQFSGKKAGKMVKKVLDSAMANAAHNFNLNPSDLYVKEVYVTPGPTLKRGRHVSRGRLVRILKRTSHITLVLDSRQKPLTAGIKSATKKPAVRSAADAPKKKTVASKAKKPAVKKKTTDKKKANESK